MAEQYIQQPRYFKIKAEEGPDLLVCASTDTIHNFPRLGINTLKYYDQDEGVMKNVFLPEEAVTALVAGGIAVAERSYMLVSEHEHWLGSCAVEAIQYLDFEPNLSGPQFGWTSEGDYITGWAT